VRQHLDFVLDPDVLEQKGDTDQAQGAYTLAMLCTTLKGVGVLKFTEQYTIKINTCECYEVINTSKPAKPPNSKNIQTKFSLQAAPTETFP
jgi:hypothetical protein